MPFAAMLLPADSSTRPLQGFSLKTLKHLVLDEADRLLNMDFEQEIDQILKVGPSCLHWMLLNKVKRTRPVLRPAKACVDRTQLGS